MQEKVYSSFTKSYSQTKLQLTKPYPGILETLEILSLSGYQMAVLSNKPHEHLVPICEEFFPNHFETKKGQIDGQLKKPNKEPLLKIMEKLGLKQCEIVYIGDSEVDIQTAKNAGVLSIAVSWGFRDRSYLETFFPDYIIDKPDELVALVLGQ